jgi:hypothetical protein
MPKKNIFQNVAIFSKIFFSKAYAIYSAPPQSLVTISFIFGDIFQFETIVIINKNANCFELLEKFGIVVDYDGCLKLNITKYKRHSKQTFTGRGRMNILHTGALKKKKTF